ncbi:DNA N-6-adenine-methyltransferase [Pontiellaceae bacterium B12227]|nr:DNA N-6-adenine-methyltransferase [Pontiellaceae bacterium B12227]
MDVHYSNETHLWETPDDFFRNYDSEFRFDLDVCALPENAKCKNFFSPADDGLEQPWDGVCWMNPPYGREIARWMKKAFEEMKRGCTVVCLVPSRTDTRWWHDYAMKGEVRFIKGRLYFKRLDGHTGRAPFPCAVIVFRPNVTDQAERSDSLKPLVGHFFMFPV